MTTKEFIERVEEFGFRVSRDNDLINIRNLFIVPEVGNDFIIHARGSYNLAELEILSLIHEYLKTPIEDREEPEKFYIKPKGLNTKEEVLNLTNNERWDIFDKSQNDTYRTQFTLKELEGLGIDVEHYDLEEVE